MNGSSGKFEAVPRPGYPVVGCRYASVAVYRRGTDKKPRHGLLPPAGDIHEFKRTIQVAPLSQMRDQILSPWREISLFCHSSKGRSIFLYSSSSFSSFLLDELSLKRLKERIFLISRYGKEDLRWPLIN